MKGLFRNDTDFAVRRWQETAFVVVVTMLLTVWWVPLLALALYFAAVALEEVHNSNRDDAERTTLLKRAALW